MSRTTSGRRGLRPRHRGPRRRGTRPRGLGHRLIEVCAHKVPDIENEVLDVEDEVVDIEDLADIVYAREVVDIENIVLGILILLGFRSSRSYPRVL